MDFLNYRWPRIGHLLTSIFVSVCVTFATSVFAADTQLVGVMTVNARPLSRSFRAYGQIEAVAVIQVRTVYPGTLQDMNVVPGDAVKAGEVLAHITGPRMQSLLTSREQVLRSAQARTTAASRALAIMRSKFKMQLATHEAIDAAQRELATAHAAVRTADVRLQEAQDLQIVHAPVTGTVMVVHATDGEQTTADQTLLTLLPIGKLWIRATYYGSDVAQLHVGMKGRFKPADGSGFIPVKVTAISSSVSPNGGYHIGLLPLSSSRPTSWANGQWGTVTLDGPPQQMIPIPTSALILDHGNWWVLLHTAKGNKPQQVIPGPSQGWQTWIASGLRSGEQIVVEDAYLEYHRGIAQSYQPPD